MPKQFINRKRDREMFGNLFKNIFVRLLFLLFLCFITNITYAGQKEAIESAKNNKITDQSSELFGCMLQEWEADLIPEKSKDETKVWNVFAYERFLACYRSGSSTGAVGELGVDTEKRRVANGTRFTAEVTCIDNVCRTEWIETSCCFNMDHEKY